MLTVGWQATKNTALGLEAGSIAEWNHIGECNVNRLLNMVNAMHFDEVATSIDHYIPTQSPPAKWTVF